MLKPGCWPGRFSGETRRTEAVERSGRHDRCSVAESADASLADMNDPSLITVRRAITDDIASLSAVSQVDYDGIILKLNQLSNQVDNLRLADNDSDGSPMDSDGEELSSSISEWRINLQKAGRILWTTSLRFAVVMTLPYRC